MATLGSCLPSNHACNPDRVIEITHISNYYTAGCRHMELVCPCLPDYTTSHRRRQSSQSRVTTDGQSASLSWNKVPSGAYDQIFITVRQLLVCWCGALSLTRGRVCRLQLPLALAIAVIFGSDSHGTRDHNLLSQIRDLISADNLFCRKRTKLMERRR
jgi:hypothetical protein